MEFNLVHLGAFFGLIALAVWAWRKHKSYDVQEFNREIRRKYK